MREPASLEVQHKPYELTAEQIAKEQMERLVDTYGTNPYVLLHAMHRELPGILHDAIELGLQLADEGLGEIAPAELLVAYAAGAKDNKGEPR